MADCATRGRLLVVDFTATWCGPCQQIAPHFEALAAEFLWCEFIKVDVDVRMGFKPTLSRSTGSLSLLLPQANQETAMACAIQAMPTFKVYRNSEEVGSIRGASPSGLRQLVEAHAGQPTPTAALKEENILQRQAAQREALRSLLAVDRDQANVAVEMLLKVFGNILADPVNPKYRTLKVDNATIKTKILACPGGRELLIAAGFQAEGVGELARAEVIRHGSIVAERVTYSPCRLTVHRACGRHWCCLKAPT